MTQAKWEPTDFVRSVSYVVREIGLSTLVVLFFLAREAGWIDSQHTLILDAVSQNQTIIRSINHYTRTTTQSLNAICYNNAKSDLEKRVCRYGVHIVDER